MIRVLHPIPSPPPDRLTVRGERFHHLAHVLRARPGMQLEVFDGAGRAAKATVVAVGADALELALGEVRDARREGARHVLLVQALPKADKLEWIIEKAVELGAFAIVPVTSARAVVKLDGERAAKKVERWRRIAEEAARQCRRADVPRVAAPVPLDRLREALPPDASVLILDEEEQARTLGAALEAIPADAPVALVVGPEGGFERAEVGRLVDGGAVPVSLGASVLRTETAGLAALAVVRHRDGLLG